MNNAVIIKRKNISAYLSLMISILALITSSDSLLNKDIYQSVYDTGVFQKTFEIGTFSQDLFSLLASIVLCITSILVIRKFSIVMHIMNIGLVSFFIYSYGLFVITGNYTSLYLNYMMIFILSFYSMITGIHFLDKKYIQKIEIKGSLKKTVAIFLIIIALLFIALWFTSLLPYLTSNLKPDFYGVYVMDLCFVMPAFIVIAVLLLMNRPFGSVLSGIALVKIFTLCFSLVIGEAFAPLFSKSTDYGMIAIYSFLTVGSLLLSIKLASEFRKVNGEV